MSLPSSVVSDQLLAFKAVAFPRCPLGPLWVTEITLGDYPGGKVLEAIK